MRVSARRAGMQPPDGPPARTALNVRPPLIPPPMSSTISRIVMPIGTSMSPPRLTLPASENTFVPLDFSVPSAANASGPCRKIHGRQARVSTLLMRVGLPQSPDCAG